MKKILTIATTAALTACLGLAACGGSQQAAQTNNAAASTAEKAPAAETTTTEKTTTEKTTTEAPAAQAPANTQAPAAQAPTATNSYIESDAALNTALSDAGVAQADAYDIEVELDTDDGAPHYDVEFKQGNTEYNYHIDATTGSIISSNVDIDD